MRSPVGPVEVGTARLEQSGDDLDAFLEPSDAMVGFDADLVVVEGVTDPDAQRMSAARYIGERGCDVGEHGRGAVGSIDDGVADLDGRRRRCEGGELMAATGSGGFDVIFVLTEESIGLWKQYIADITG